MTDRPLRRGRRDNGLDASEYVPAADVDPRIGEHLLDVLALAKIAAYLQPSSDLDPVTRSSMLPATPTDRLFVDRDHLDEAREYTRRLEAGDDPANDELAEEGGGFDEFETRWRELVAQLENDTTDTTDADSDSSRTSERGGTAVGAKEKDLGLPRLRSPLPGHGPDDPTLLDALDADYDDEDDRFVPPNPPPLPSLSRPTVLSLIAILAGLLVLIWPQSLAYLSLTGTDTAMVVATVLFILGGIGLVYRLRPAPDDDDPDDGARV